MLSRVESWELFIGPLIQLGEMTDLKSVQYGFESHKGHKEFHSSFSGFRNFLAHFGQYVIVGVARQPSLKNESTASNISRSDTESFSLHREHEIVVSVSMLSRRLEGCLFFIAINYFLNQLILPPAAKASPQFILPDEMSSAISSACSFFSSSVAPI